MGVFERKWYKGVRDGQHRKDIQINEKQGEDRKELYRVVMGRRGSKTGLPIEPSAVHTVHSRYRRIPNEKIRRRNYHWDKRVYTLVYVDDLAIIAEACNLHSKG